MAWAATTDTVPASMSQGSLLPLRFLLVLVRRVREPGASQGTRLPARGEPRAPRATRQAPAAVHGRTTRPARRHGQGARQVGARRRRVHRDPGHAAALAPSAGGAEVDAAWCPSPRPATGDAHDPRVDAAHGEGQPGLGLHQDRRCVGQRRVQRRADDGREDPESRRHRPGSRAADLVAHVLEGPRRHDRRRRLLLRRSVDRARAGDPLRAVRHRPRHQGGAHRGRHHQSRRRVHGAGRATASCAARSSSSSIATRSSPRRSATRWRALASRPR